MIWEAMQARDAVCEVLKELLGQSNVNGHAI